MQKEVLINVCEVYPSTQTLSVVSGLPVTVIRLFGNNFQNDKNDLREYATDTKKATKDNSNVSRMNVRDLAKLISDVKHSSAVFNWVIAGGEPMMQQGQVLELVKEFKELTGRMPFIQWETNGLIAPTKEVNDITGYFNVHVKLGSATSSASRDTFSHRIKPGSLKELVANPKASFYFLIKDGTDVKEVQEIQKMFKIQASRIVLIPNFLDFSTLKHIASMVQNSCLMNGYRFLMRNELLIHGIKRGV